MDKLTKRERQALEVVGSASATTRRKGKAALAASIARNLRVKESTGAWYLSQLRSKGALDCDFIPIIEGDPVGAATGHAHIAMSFVEDDVRRALSQAMKEIGEALEAGDGVEALIQEGVATVIKLRALLAEQERRALALTLGGGEGK